MRIIYYIRFFFYSYISCRILKSLLHLVMIAECTHLEFLLRACFLLFPSTAAKFHVRENPHSTQTHCTLVLLIFLNMLKFLSGKPSNSVSKSFWKPSSSRSHASNVFCPRFPIFAEERNPFEVFINSFARSKPCGVWTKQQCLKAGRDIWTSQVSPNGKLNSESYDHWIENYPCPEIVPPKYIPARAVLQKPIEAKADEASDLQQCKSEVDSSFDCPELDAANEHIALSKLESKTMQELFKLWALNLEEIGLVIEHEPIFQKTLLGSSKSLLRFEQACQKFELTVKTSRRVKNTQTRENYRCYSEKLSAAIEKMQNGAKLYAATAIGGITSNLSADFISAKVMLSQKEIQLRILSYQLWRKENLLYYK